MASPLPLRELRMSGANSAPVARILPLWREFCPCGANSAPELVGAVIRSELPLLKTVGAPANSQ